jgi:hypothetical protein
VQIYAGLQRHLCPAWRDLAMKSMLVSFVVYALRSARIVHRNAVCILQIIVKNALKHAANVPLNVKTWLIDPA